MSRSLAQQIDDFLVKNGPAGKAELCRSVAKSERTLDRWIKEGVPTSHDAYKLAKAIKCTDEEALKLAKQCTSEASRTA